MTAHNPDAMEQFERERVDAHELSFALRELYRMFGGFERELARRLEMRPGDFAAMERVLEALGSLGPSQLSADLRIAPGSTTELVDRLERAGHVERVRDPADRRRISLRATESAIAAIGQHLFPMFAELDSFADSFTPEEQDAISRYLRGASERLRGFTSTGD